MTIKKNPDEEALSEVFRSSVDGMLGRRGAMPITKSEWAVLRKQGYPRHFAAGDPDALNDACDFVTDARLSQRPSEPGGEAANKTLQSRLPQTAFRAWHEMALSRVFVAHAMEEDAKDRQFGFLLFRKEVLKDHLIARAAAGTWIVEQAKRDGKPTVHNTKWSGGERWYIDTLDYCVDGDQWVHSVPVNQDGVLGRLRSISVGLQEFYGWSMAHASFFVLTGVRPIVGSMRSTVSMKIPLQARRRITLEIDPTCTPLEVARAYQKIKRESFGRLRRLGPKHASLAAFYAEQPDEMPAKDQVDAWNAWCVREKHNEWRYSKKDAARFTRDAKLALDRLANLSGSKGLVRFFRTRDAEGYTA